VTVGRRVVMVGGEVVIVVVGGEVVVVGDVDPEGATGSGEAGVVADGNVVVVVGVVEDWVGTELEDSEAPGCSLATTTPRAMVAPVATKAARRVRRRRRALARRLVFGELDCGSDLIDFILWSTSVHRSSDA